MKKNSILTLVLLLTLVSGASAAQSPVSAEPLALPTYVVETGRSAEAEQSINASLAALRAQAGEPVRVTVELPALKAQVARVAKVVVSTLLAKS